MGLPTNSGLAVLFLAVALTSPMARAQPSQALERTGNQSSFRVGFLKGCLAGNVVGINNKQNFCSCLVDSYEARYESSVLAVISELAQQLGARGAILADTMMLPERRNCASRS
jgi:hypothetical protein